MPVRKPLMRDDRDDNKRLLEKINCFFFEQNASNVLIEVAEKQIRDNSSEANLLPEFDVIKNHFNDIAYFFRRQK